MIKAYLVSFQSMIHGRSRKTDLHSNFQRVSKSADTLIFLDTNELWNYVFLDTLSNINVSARISFFCRALNFPAYIAISSLLCDAKNSMTTPSLLVVMLFLLRCLNTNYMNHSLRFDDIKFSLAN